MKYEDKNSFLKSKETFDLDLHWTVTDNRVSEIISMKKQIENSYEIENDSENSVNQMLRIKIWEVEDRGAFIDHG